MVRGKKRSWRNLSIFFPCPLHQIEETSRVGSSMIFHRYDLSGTRQKEWSRVHGRQMRSRQGRDGAETVGTRARRPGERTREGRVLGAGPGLVPFLESFYITHNSREQNSYPEHQPFKDDTLFLKCFLSKGGERWSFRGNSGERVKPTLQISLLPRSRC